jgi:GNAT superfamily N-acetyltransferase
MRLQIVPFEAGMLDEAGRLFAARHRRLRELRPELPSAFAQPEVGRAAVAAAWARDGAEGFAALRGDRLAAFLIGDRVIEEIWGRSAWVRFAGCAHAPDEDVEIVRDLYAALGDGWVRIGCYTHFALMPVEDPALVERWFALCFGIEQVIGLLSLAEIDLSPLALPPGVTIRLAEKGDRANLEEISDVIWRHQVQAPVWGIQLPEILDQQRKEWGGLLDEGDVTIFLAFDQGEPVGIQGWYPAEAGLDDPTVPEACVHLGPAGTREQARGRGIGRALSRCVLAHARQAGYRFCHTDWRSTNLLASRVWPRIGFHPAVYRLSRRVDARIAWAGERGR